MTYTPDQLDAVRAQAAAQRPRPAAKRKGKTPEAKVKAAIDAYLKRIGAINIRTNAGSWQDESGHWIMGAKAGTADNIACLPQVGLFCAIEAKSATGTPSEAQRRFHARVEALGGLYILARSVADVRAALVARFGESVVAGWENDNAVQRHHP